MDVHYKFPIQKWGIFRKVKKIKELCGGVRRYAAQLIPKIDTEIVEKGHFWVETNYETVSRYSNLYISANVKNIVIIKGP